MKEKFEELLRIARGHTVCIQTHDYPDPDALACAYALQELLRRYGIVAEIGHFGTVDKVNIRMMMDIFEIRTMTAGQMAALPEDAVVINVDVQKNNSNLTDMRGEELVCIDHHPWVTKEQYAVVIHKLVGSCATIVTQLFTELGEEIPQTGVTDDDLAAFSMLHRIANHDIIRQLDNNSLQLSDLRAYGAAIQNIAVYDGIGFVHIPFDCPDGLIASVSNFILELDAVKLAVVYADRNGGLKFSVRSEVSSINAGQLVNLALRGVGNGGGHATMAGGLLYRERISELGSDMDTAIHKRFGEALEMVKNG